MKALTIWQPWASLIAIGAKPYEFRRWPAPRSLHGQRVAIHAGVRKINRTEIRALIIALRGKEPGRQALKPDLALALLDRLFSDPTRAPLGVIVATAVLGAPVRADKIMSEFGVSIANDSDRDEAFNYAWPLSSIEPLAPPIPARGAQGFWEWIA